MKRLESVGVKRCVEEKVLEMDEVRPALTMFHGALA